MRRKQLTWLCAGWFLAPPFLLFSDPALAAPQNSSTYSALNRCGVAVVLPTPPPGYRQTSFKTRLCEVSCRYNQIPCRNAYSQYSVLYKGPNRCSIEFTGLVGGMFGDGPPPRTWSTQTRLFGRMKVTESYDLSYLHGLSTRWDRENSVSLWNKNYHKRFPDAQFVYNFKCDGRSFDPEIALDTLRSLRVVAAD